jgi:hypothetical protein
MTIRVITRHAEGHCDAIDWLVHDRAGAALFAINRAHDLGIAMRDDPEMTERTVEVWYGPVLNLSIAIRSGGLDPVKAASRPPATPT